MNEFVVKDCSVFFTGKVAAPAPPLGNGGGSPPHQLAHAGFAFRSPFLAVEVLGGDNTGGGDEPVFGYLDVLLFKDHFAGFAGNGRGPVLPLERIVRGNAFAGEMAPALQPLLPLR